MKPPQIAQIRKGLEGSNTRYRLVEASLERARTDLFSWVKYALDVGLPESEIITLTGLPKEKVAKIKANKRLGRMSNEYS